MRNAGISSHGPFLFLRVFLAVSFILLLSHQAALHSALAANGIADGETVSIETVTIEGLLHTKPETILRLLPRSVPAEFTRAGGRGV
jgi:hypothetical protein